MFQLYIILIRPERNVRQSMMPMRYSAINKSSGTTGSGAGSMMAAVMVTAATCNQKQQIQKHVPPIDTELSEKDGKKVFRIYIKLQYVQFLILTADSRITLVIYKYFHKNAQDNYQFIL